MGGANARTFLKPAGVHQPTNHTPAGTLLHILIFSPPYDSCESCGVLNQKDVQLLLWHFSIRVFLRVSLMTAWSCEWQSTRNTNRSLFQKKLLRERKNWPLLLNFQHLGTGSEARDVHLPTAAHSASQGSIILSHLKDLGEAGAHIIPHMDERSTS